MKYFPDFEEFRTEASKVIEKTKGMEANAGESNEYPVLVSCVPWFHFEAVTLPDYTFRQSRPIITYGRLKDGEIPVNIRAHHAFVDGKHISCFVDLLTPIWAKPEEMLK